MSQAMAYVNWGRWVVNCPNLPCTGAREVIPGEVTVHCVYCNETASIVWPSNGPEITAELNKRPVPSTRNWFPGEHPMALLHGLPAGQSVAELRAETAEHLAKPDKPPETMRDRVNKALAEIGYRLSSNGSNIERL